ncbi:SEL1-like repeat protein [Snodgrassella communis]|uniref:SEL1-like repeat protein n=1 Tax=Snodgrassella communis TaxID=2946699 RepID=UPI0009B89385
MSKASASKQNYEKAAEYFQLATDQGEAAAQANLGYLYDTGKGVREDYIKSHEYYLLAAD